MIGIWIVILSLFMVGLAFAIWGVCIVFDFEIAATIFAKILFICLIFSLLSLLLVTIINLFDFL
jgi:hypothetical protein